MKDIQIPVGFIPLVDAAPLIVAQEMGFAAEERLSLELRRAPSWSSIRDMLRYGRVDAAHMLSPVPVAGALGLGGAGAPLCALSVLSVNGHTIGVSADRRGHGYGAALLDAGLRRLHDNGINGCVIDWTGLVDFYARFGFERYRSYTMLARSLR